MKAHPKVIATYIVNWKDYNGADPFYQLCKVHMTEDGSYYREYDTGRTKIVAIGADEFNEQIQNPLINEEF